MAITPGDYAGYDSTTTKTAQVDSNETDFPYYIDLSNLSATWWSNVQADGGDIRVTTSDDGTGQVPIEVFSIDTGTSTGELHFKDSTDASATKTYYVWCGTSTSDSQPAVTGTYGRNNVWTKYVFVTHLESTSSITDSTGNGVTATFNGTVTGVPGQLSESRDFDGTVTENDYVETGFTPGGLLTDDTDSTWSCWFNWDGTTQSSGGNYRDELFSIWSTASGADRTINYENIDSQWRVQVFEDANNTSTLLSISTPSTNAWHHTAVAIDATTDFEVYRDGASLGSAAITGVHYSDTHDMWLAGFNRQSFGDERLFDGTIDEFRVASSRLSAGWVSTEHSMQDDNSTFWTFNGWTAQAVEAANRPLSFGAGL